MSKAVLTISKVHDDAKLPILGLEHLDELNDVGMRQHLEDLRLLDRLFALRIAHLAYIDLLHDTF